jgi:citrate synthase
MKQISQTDKDVVNIAGMSPSEVLDLGFFGTMAEVFQLPEDAMAAISAVAAVFMDHGEDPPSTVAVRMAASTGVGLAGSLACGLQVFQGEFHGGGIDRVAEMLTRFVAGDENAPNDFGKRVPGLGHPMHDHDPRVASLTREFYNRPEAIHLAEIWRISEVNQVPPNIAGVGTAILLDAGVPPELCSLIFILGRCVGWAAHWRERTADPRKNQGIAELRKSP